MKLLFSYTLDYMKRNRRSSLSIMVAILMTATMLSALCGFLYNIYADNLSLILRQTGNWHGELFDATLGSSLPVIEGFDSVETMLIKGDWKTAQIDDPRRDYLVWRDANKAYWEGMPEGSIAILEGRVPIETGEIALSKQYFEHHPELAIGGTLTLPIGDRISTDESVIAPQSVSQPGERFVQTGMVTLTVVGKMDVASSGTVPAYVALGYLDPTAILPSDELTIYFRFHNIHDTYKELDSIAAAVGYEPDEYGNYMLRYNTSYLTRMGVLSPEQTGLLPKLLTAQMPLTFACIGFLAVGLFVLIIHNAFALSFSARISQLGIFASVGATPKQIKRSVVLEALLLTAAPLPLGLLLGNSVVWMYIHFANTSALGNTEPMAFVVGWQSVLPAILLTLLTVWWSALIPARKIAKMSPIAAIRQGGAEKLKKPGRFSLARLGGLFGLSGELAANALQARKKSYRTTTVSLTLSFLILAGLLCITSASTASKAIYQNKEKAWAEQDILLTLSNVTTAEDFSSINDKVTSLETVSSARWYNSLRVAAWIPEDAFSPEFEEKGGFAAVEKSISEAQIPFLRDGNRRVVITVVGLDDHTFAAYCAQLGLDPTPFYQEDRWRSILYHTVNDVVTGTKRTPIPIPFLDVAIGDTLTLTEKRNDDYKGDFTFPTEVTAIATEMPPLGSPPFGVRYSALQFMPMSRVEQLASHFFNPTLARRINGVIQVSNPAQISPTRTAIEQISESYFGSGDYDLMDENESYANDALGEKLASMMFGFVAGLLGVIGLSNAWSTVRGTLNARRREFAMLRSVGLPPKGLVRMLSLEAMMLGITPILIGLPIMIVMQGIFLAINEVSFLEWLPYAPWLPLLLYIVAVLSVTVAAYIIGGRKLQNENIIEAIKVDSI